MINAIVALLDGDAAVGALAGDRNYPIKAPDNPTYPFITVQRVGTRHDHTAQGNDNLPRARVQIDAWAKTIKQAYALGDAIRVLLDDYSGVAAGVDIRDGSLSDARDFHEDATGSFRVSQDFFFYYVQ